MIINYDTPGQLCNRIWSLIPSIAYGLELEEKVLIINFDGYTDDFEDLNKNKLIRFASRNTVRRILMFLKARGYIKNGKSNILRRLFGFNFIEGWLNRLGNTEMVKNQSDEIRKIFAFNSRVSDSVDKVFASLDDFSVVGVHIRRGDYKEWLNGIYYYTDDEYICILKNIEEKLKSEGVKVKFLLCSNEKINLENYRELDCFSLQNTYWFSGFIRSFAV